MAKRLPVIRTPQHEVTDEVSRLSMSDAVLPLLTSFRKAAHAASGSCLRSRGRIFSVLRISSFRAGLLATGLLALTVGQASAQLSGGASAGTLSSLLQQLQQLEGTGALNEFGNTIIRSPLDDARESAQRDRVSVRQTELNVGGAEQRTSGINPQVELAIESFCRGALSEKDVAALLKSISYSALEKDYCLRSGEFLLLQGYALAQVPSETSGLTLGAIPPDYVLGTGDQLILTFAGQEDRVLTVSIDREGRVLLPGWQPISAAGRTFADVRREIEVRTSIGQLASEVFVSLGAVRAIAVTVLGEVELPGKQQLNSFSTVIDALTSAGGIKKSGSLRRIKITRENKSFWIDFYDVLYAGNLEVPLDLRDGDVISIPSRGPTFAVAGEVQKPGIYELPEGFDSISVAEVLDIAGGTLRPRGNRFLHFSFQANGHERVDEHQNFAAKIREGEILKVALGSRAQVASVYLDGHVRVPGRRSLTATSTVAQLLGDVSALGDDPYLLFGVLETTDPTSQIRRLFPLNLLNVIKGAEDYSLREGDRLVVLGDNDIRFLASSNVYEIIRRKVRSIAQEAAGPETPGADAEPAQDSAAALPQLEGLSQAELQRILLGGAQDDAAGQVIGSARDGAATQQPRQQPRECLGLRRLAAVLSATAVSRYINAARRFDDDPQLDKLNRQTCPAIYDRYGDLLPLALEHMVAVNGAVRRPGAYPVVGNISLAPLVTAAGGLSRNVDLTRVEIFRSATDPVQGTADSSLGLVNIAKVGADQVVVGAGDVVRFNPVLLDRDAGPVYLAGEFVRPGYYEIRRGERLSELILRAGGLTEQAYPYGAIFTRETVKRIQRIGFQRAARELTSAIAVAAVQSNVDINGLLRFQQFARQLDSVEALGRVVIEADPAVLQVRPEFDIVLQPGDRLYMPKRPNFVVVIGDVLNPGAMQFISGNSADTYIRQAGGLQRSADEDRIFVVYPNGAAEPLGITVWNYNPVQIPPGSTIVVPKDPAPLDLLTVLRDGSQLVGQLAVTAASLAVISRD